MFCHELFHRYGLANMSYSQKKKGEMRGKFPHILFWKDVQVGDKQVQSGFTCVW